MTKRQKGLTPDAQSLAEEQSRHLAKAYEEIGRGISSWSAVEMRLVQIVSVLLGVTAHKAGLILYSINNFYAWLTIIDGLFADAPIHKIASRQWSKLASQLKSQNDIRVQLAHHSLFLDVFETEDGRIKTRFAGLRASPLDIRVKSLKLKPLKVEEIVKFRERSFDLHDKLLAVYKLISPA